MGSSLRISVCVFSLFACLWLVRCDSSRCPSGSGSGSGVFSGNRSGVFSGSGSGSGFGITCDELLDPEEDVLVAFNFYCRNIFNPDPGCESESCRFCKELVECNVTVGDQFDVCASDLLLGCSTQPQIPVLTDLYRGVCQFAADVCLDSDESGVCASRRLIDICRSVAGLSYPCDCFVPNTTCELCSSVLPLCSAVSSGSGSSGSADICEYLESEDTAGYLFLCQTLPVRDTCPYSEDTCQFCSSIALSGCDNLTRYDLYDICGRFDIILSCADSSAITPNSFLSDICPLLSTCTNNSDTGICSSDAVLQCHDVLSFNTTCNAFASEGYCGLCWSIILLCGVGSGSGRCPFVSGSGSGSGVSSSGSGVFSGSGSGSGMICDELLDPDEDILVAFNFYCRNIFNPDPGCESESCRFCKQLVECNVTVGDQFDVCASDLPLVCSTQLQIPVLTDLYRRVCQFAADVCLDSDESGICASRDLIDACRSVTGLPYPCDCFVPNTTCELCSSVLPLCSAVSSGSGSTMQPQPTVTQLPSTPTQLSSSQPPTQPSSQPPIQPSVSMPPSSEPPTQPSSQPPIQPSVSMPPTQPSSQPPTQPSSLPPSQPPTQPSSLPPTQPSSQPPTQPSSEPPTQPSTSLPPTQPSPSPGPPTFPEGTAVAVENLDEEQAANTVNIQFKDITATEFLEKEKSFRISVAEAINKAGDSQRRRKRQNDQLTADDIKYVGQPVVEDDGTLVVAFFAQRPGGNVVDGDTLVNVVNDDSDVISAATGGTVLGVEKGLPDALLPPETDAPESDDSGGLSGGEVAAIVVVLLVAAAVVGIVVVGVLVVMQRRRRRFEIITAGDEYHSADGTYHTDTFEQGSHGKPKSPTGSGTFPLKPSANVYSPVPAEDTAVTNEAAITDEGKGGMKEEEEEEEDDNATEKDPLGERSKDTHL